MVRVSKNAKYDFYKSWYWPSSDAITNVIHCDLDLYFQGKKYSGNHKIYNIFKTVRGSEKCIRLIG